MLLVQNMVDGRLVPRTHLPKHYGKKHSNTPGQNSLILRDVMDGFISWCISVDTYENICQPHSFILSIHPLSFPLHAPIPLIPPSQPIQSTHLLTTSLTLTLIPAYPTLSNPPFPQFTRRRRPSSRLRAYPHQPPPSIQPTSRQCECQQASQQQQSHPKEVHKPLYLLSLFSRFHFCSLIIPFI